MTPERHIIDDILDDLGPLPDEQPQSNGQSHHSNGNQPFDMPGFLARHGLRVRDTKSDAGYGTKYILEECPFDSSHKAPDSYVAVMPSGALCFKCSHNSCASYKWQDFRNRFEPGYRDKKPDWDQKSREHHGFDKDQPQAAEPTQRPATYKSMKVSFPALRPPIIHGLLREGETANIIASTKVGKSWLAVNLALCVCTGRRFLDTFWTVPGKVLIIDNELHGETVTDRIGKVAAALGLKDDAFDEHLHVESLRGKLRDINRLGSVFDAFEPGELKLVIVDAFYRCLPRGFDENKNADIAQIYNTVDAYAGKLRCAIASVHHATKGSQVGKSVTDVGSGAGAFSRAVDCHFILRPHAEPDASVVEAALRSWAPIEPIGLRWSHPLWTLDESIDVTALPAKPGRKATPKPTEGVPWDPDKPTAFQVNMGRIREYLTEHGPATRTRLKNDLKMSGTAVKDAVDALLEFGQVEECEVGEHKGIRLADTLPGEGGTDPEVNRGDGPGGTDGSL